MVSSILDSTMEEEEVSLTTTLMVDLPRQVGVGVCVLPVEAFLAGSVPYQLESLQANSNRMVWRHSN